MARVRITLEDARDADHQVLLERVEELLSQYDRPEGPELQQDKLARLDRTIEEIPIHYRWLLQLESFCDHWTDAMMDMLNGKDPRYKRWRERRDLFKSMASAAKMRYEGASRELTRMIEFDPTGMPRTRRGGD